MGHFSYMFNGLVRSFSIKKRKHSSTTHGEEVVEEMVKEAKKNNLILRSSGFVNVEKSTNFASVYTKRGEKGINQDCCFVWEEFGCQPDMMLCGVFDGHGQWGHFVSKRVSESIPSCLLRAWQETLAEAACAHVDFDKLKDHKKLQWFNTWKDSYLKAFAAVDQELEHHRRIDAFYSGSTGLSVLRQGERIIVANVGDSRAVLATTSEDGSLVAIQLTVDFKPNLPEEAERIIQCNGRVFSLHDEPGLHRVWLPDHDSPGLAMSRAFGDYCLKDFGLISVPDVTQRCITNKDQFLVVATDGVWDVLSNEEVVRIVSSTPDRAKSAKQLVKHAAQAWKRKRRGIAMDDISAICLFFHSYSTPPNSDSFLPQVHPDSHSD